MFFLATIFRTRNNVGISNQRNDNTNHENRAVESKIKVIKKFQFLIITHYLRLERFIVNAADTNTDIIMPN